jgi:hypothetical protein
MFTLDKDREIRVLMADAWPISAIARPVATPADDIDRENASRDHARDPGGVVVVANGPPTLTPGAARALLRILLMAAERNNG